MTPVLFKAMIALLIFKVLNIALFGFGMFEIILSYIFSIHIIHNESYTSTMLK